MTTDFTATKKQFSLPKGIIYLDGNSLGPLPTACRPRADKVIDHEWGESLITSWNVHHWNKMPLRVGNLIAPLIGAPQNSVIMGDTLSIKVYQALAAALKLREGRKVIISDRGNFPTDIYMAEGLVATMNAGHKIDLPEPEGVEAAIQKAGKDLAVLMLTHVDYRTGRRHDMARLTKLAHDQGAVVIWDLAHSAGAMDLDIHGSKCEFAVGCTYKFLNGGPGAPAFIYVRPDLIDNVEAALAGWMGHAAPFAFELGYRPSQGISRLRVGTPPIIQLAVLEEALGVWQNVNMKDLRAKSLALADRFRDLVQAISPDLKPVTPKDNDQRGSQMSFYHESGFAIMQALIEKGVIGDYREPGILRFGITPLYIDESDIDNAAAIFADIYKSGIWQDPKYAVRGDIT